MLSTVGGAGTALVGSFGQAAQVFRRGGIPVGADSHASYVASNQVTIRAEERLGLAVYRPSAYTVVSGFSPIVSRPAGYPDYELFMVQPVPTDGHVSAGAYRCTNCGRLLVMPFEASLAPCPGCKGTSFEMLCRKLSLHACYPGRN